MVLAEGRRQWSPSVTQKHRVVKQGKSEGGRVPGSVQALQWHGLLGYSLFRCRRLSWHPLWESN